MTIIESLRAMVRDPSDRIDARLARMAETTEEYIQRERMELLHLHGLGPEWEDALLDLCGAYPIAEPDAAQALTLTLACDRDPGELIRLAGYGADPLETARSWQTEGTPPEGSALDGQLRKLSTGVDR